MSRSKARGIATLIGTIGLVLGTAGVAVGYQDVHIPPAACESVQEGIAHFHDSPAPAHMQETPAWGNTSRFVYDRCE